MTVVVECPAHAQRADYRMNDKADKGLDLRSRHVTPLVISSTPRYLHNVSRGPSL